MKIETQAVEVLGTPALEEIRCGVDAENIPFLLEILRSDKFYKNKIRIVCQEYMCNAKDANREVGNENVPIEIHLPNDKDMTWWVRDFGPGITPERMRNIFTRYGSSTKRSTNLDIGGFGLGSKSGWAYGSQFHITTYIDGTMRKYVAYIDDSGYGQVDLKVQTETDEKNGTKVSIPVVKGDEQKFKEWTDKSGRYWDLKPNVINEGFTFTEPEYLYENSKGKIEKSHGYSYYHHTTRIIVGGIAYDLDQEQIDFDHNFNFYFGIGEVTVAANRESLSYDEKTINAIKDRYKKFIIEAEVEFAANMGTPETLYEAVKLWKSQPSQIRNVVKEFVFTDKNGKKRVVNERTQFLLGCSTKFKCYGKDGHFRKTSQGKIIDINQPIYVHDFTRDEELSPTVGRMRTIFQTTDLEHIQIVTTEYPRKDSYVSHESHINALNRYNKTFLTEISKLDEWGVPYTRLSTIPKTKAPVKPKEKQVKEVAKETEISAWAFGLGYYSGLDSQNWSIERGATDKVYYVLTKGKKPIDQETFGADTIGNTIKDRWKNIAEMLSINISKIVFVSITKEKKIKNEPNWVPLEEKIFEELVIKIKKTDNLGTLRQWEDFGDDLNWLHLGSCKWDKLIRAKKKRFNSKTIRKIIEYDELSSQNNLHQIETLQEYNTLKLPQSCEDKLKETDEETLKAVKKLNEELKLFRTMRLEWSYDYDETSNYFIDFINSLDI